MKKNKSTVDRVVRCLTNSKTFRAFWREQMRHSAALLKIYGNDKLHVHVPEEVGTFSQVFPGKAHVVTFYRCAVCMKDLTEKEVAKLTKP